MEGQHEAFRTPTGTCFVGAPGLRHITWYSPCRDQLMASAYRESYYGEGGGGGWLWVPPTPGRSDPALCPQPMTSATARSASARLSPG